ncbi:MAG: hypothetical protein ACRD5L_05195, partial [Bryobacteraceae bacterium]
MTRDEIRNLIGGYATGSLSESERKLLFDAALEDQELFDQLTQEQALKELLEEPGAKQRLLTALGSESVPEKRRLVGWPWALAAAGCLAVVIGVVMLRAPEKPREIAAVAQPVEQETPAIAPQSVAPVAPPVVRLASPKQKSIAAAPRVENAPVALPTPAPAEPSKAEKTAQPSVDAIQEVAVAPAPPQPLANGFVAGRTPQLQGGPIQAQTAGAADAFGKDGGRGGRGGPPSQNAAARAVASRFAFD